VRGAPSAARTQLIELEVDVPLGVAFLRSKRISEDHDECDDVLLVVLITSCQVSEKMEDRALAALSRSQWPALPGRSTRAGAADASARWCDNAADVMPAAAPVIFRVRSWDQLLLCS